jgi:hypothetical protein
MRPVRGKRWRALIYTDGVQADNFNVDPTMLLTSVFGALRVRSGPKRKGE